MIKRFFISFLGSMAAIWLSAGLLVILFFMTIGIAMAGMNTTVPTSIKPESVLYLQLSGTVTERVSPTNIADVIYGTAEKAQGLNDITGAIRKAATDSRISGIYLDCGGVSTGIASLQAIREALTEFKKSGKWIQAYSDSYAQGDYYVASVADSLILNPIGCVDLHGLAASTTFFTGLFEKLGIEMQVIRVGSFKSAVEPYMLKEMSPASRMQQQEYINSIWDVLRSQMAESRELDPADIDNWADSMVMTRDARFFIDNGIVDRLAYRHDAEQSIASLVGKDKSDDVNFVSVNDYCLAEQVLDPKAWGDFKSDKSRRIAILYAVGNIVDGGDEGIVGDKMVQQIMELADDDDVAGLILRINSGGGSAFASEQIWEALERFKESGKAFYASMGDVAASGGYYIACGADRIYAQPTTLTGSIGIFGLIPNIKGLLNDHLGITTGTVSSNANGNFPTITEPMTPFQQIQMQHMIDRGYETFVGRCADGRGMPVDSIKAIAEGRVWSGTAAVSIGLVDKLGGLDKAIADMASTLGKRGASLHEYPSVNKKWWEELLEIEGTIHERAMQRQLGQAYPLYKEINRACSMEPIQCVMEPVELR